MDRTDVVLRSGTMATLFAVFGLGTGVAGLLVLTAVPGESAGTELVQAAIFRSLGVGVYLLGPVLAGVMGLVAGRISSDRRGATVLGGVVGILGFYVFAVVALLTMSFGVSGGVAGGAIWGESGGLDLLLLVQVGLPAGFVGGLSAYIRYMLH